MFQRIDYVDEIPPLLSKVFYNKVKYKFSHILFH